jgi:hypothetical protein
MTASSVAEQGVKNCQPPKALRDKAAEGQPQSKTLRETWRYINSDRFWTAAVLLSSLPSKILTRHEFSILPVWRNA